MIHMNIPSPQNDGLLDGGNVEHPVKHKQTKDEISPPFILMNVACFAPFTLGNDKAGDSVKQ